MSQEKNIETLDSKRILPEELSEHLRAIESKVDGLVPHVLQLENAAILIIGLIVLLQVLGTLWLTQPNTEIARLYWFVPYATLFLVGRVIKIRNPYNRVAEVVETGFNYAGAGALVGGSITGLLSGGLGAPAGGAIGGGVGLVVGIFAGIFKTPKRTKKHSSERVPCRFCGRQISRTDNYCEECGKEQASNPINCPRCNAKVSAYAKFCPTCGETLLQAEKTPLLSGSSPSVDDHQELNQNTITGGAQSQAADQNRRGAPVALGRFAHLTAFDDDLEEPPEEGRANSAPTGIEEG
jgi:RNA polymerase subunit RPABC4/transcription elongation factor Spt4